MKILILTDKYYPQPYANAICAQELIRVWRKGGHSVDVLAYGNGDGSPYEWEGNRVFYVKPSIKLKLLYFADSHRGTKKGKIAGRLGRFISRLLCLLLLPWTPLESATFPKKIHKQLNKLYLAEHYDAMVSVLNPLTSAIAADKLKKAHPELPYIVYCVDDLRLGLVRKYFGEKVADPFYWQKRILNCCDAYFYMESRRADYSRPEFDSYRGKLVETDLPRLKIKDCSGAEKFDFDNGGENWVYAGSIGGIHYSADQMINIFERVSPKGCKRILHMYIRGSEADRINTLVRKNGLNIRVHDYVDAGTLEQIMVSADFIVTLKTSDQISAKIFECMSYCKPLIHFSGCKEDPDVKYLEKYPRCKVVRMYSGDLAGEISALSDFIVESKNEAGFDPNRLEKIFEKSTPEYSASAIIERIERAKAK